MAWTGALAENSGGNSPKAIYLSQCGVCHGRNDGGIIAGDAVRLWESGTASRRRQIRGDDQKGKGRMPGFRI